MPRMTVIELAIDGAADAAGLRRGPGRALLRCADRPVGRRGRIAIEIIAIGEAEVIARHPASAAAREVDVGRRVVLLPGLVNAHAHLDLTALGPRPMAAGGFPAWAGAIRAARAELDLAASVDEGVDRTLAGGVVAIGDIAGAGRTEPAERLRASGLEGVSYLELFGFGDRATVAIERASAVLAAAPAGERLAIGLQPHAPYSAGPSLYAWCAAAGVPVATHLAETPEERRFVAEGAGPLRDMLAQMGLWTDAVAGDVGRGASPVAHLAASLRRAPWLCAHANDVDERDVEELAACGATVAFCPRAHAYFGHAARGPHPRRRLRAAGVRVVLATDSIVCLPPAEAARLSPLDDARLLHRRDGVDGATLLAMATTLPAAALGLDPDRFLLRPGPVAGVCAVDVDATDPHADAFDRVLATASAPREVVADPGPAP